MTRRIGCAFLPPWRHICTRQSVRRCTPSVQSSKISAQPLNVHGCALEIARLHGIRGSGIWLVEQALLMVGSRAGVGMKIGDDLPLSRPPAASLRPQRRQFELIPTPAAGGLPAPRAFGFRSCHPAHLRSAASSFYSHGILDAHDAGDVADTILDAPASAVRRGPRLPAGRPRARPMRALPRPRYRAGRRVAPRTSPRIMSSGRR